jgi:hypothetical protein
VREIRLCFGVRRVSYWMAEFKILSLRKGDSHLKNDSLNCAIQWFTLLTPPMKVGQTECSEMLAFKLQTPGNQKRAFDCILLFVSVDCIS